MSCPSPSDTCVPTGTRNSTSSPLAPCFPEPRPGPPRPATYRRPGAKRREVAQVRIGDEHDVTARAAVTPVGAATRYVLLAPEAERAVSTTPGDRGDAGAVVEHRRSY